MGNSGFTEEEVRVIKRELKRGISPRELAGIYLCGLETIRKIGRGDTFAWVEEEDGREELAAAAARIPNKELDEKAQESLKRLLAMGAPIMKGEEPSALDKMNQEIREIRDREEELDKFIKPDGE